MAAGACLEDDEMASFVEGQLTRSRRKEVLVHIDSCDACRDLAAALARDPDASASITDDARDPVPSMSDLEVGEIVSQRFVLGKALGRGAIGTVFRAHDRERGTDVALKLMRHEDSKSRKAALDRELKAGRKIVHPNVCRLFDAGSTHSYDYITMELIEGRTLAQLLAAEEPSSERVMEILRGIAAGLGAAHAKGIVHRDVKPANVMVENVTGRIVLTDFGFAADLDSKQSRRLVGTPAYWAPEQARGERPTAACDVYSFGVLAYRLLTGRDFSLSDPNALGYVPSRYRRAVAKCVEVRPAERFADAREAGAAFDSPSRGAWPYVAAFAAVSLGIVVWAVGRSPAPSVDAASVAPVVSSAPVVSVATVEKAERVETSPAASVADSPVASASAHPTRPVTVVPARPSASAAAPPPPTPPASASSHASPSDLLYRH